MCGGGAIHAAVAESLAAPFEIEIRTKCACVIGYMFAG
jgi:hypothetical protein